jgi:hypothetical protein
MVRNEARKHTARTYAAATGISHAAAVRQTRHNADGFSALGVHTTLMEALQRAGWPVELETVPENVEYRGSAGPVRFTVGRADQVDSFGGDDPDPDDCSRLDLSRPPRIEMVAAPGPTGVEAHSEIVGDRPTADVITEVGRMLTAGRARAVRQAVNQAACTVCGDAYPRTHLLAAAGKAELPLCPVCAFDGDVFVTGDMASAYLTYQIDDLATTDLVMPAGWAGPAALLACAAPAGFGDRLESLWRRAGMLLLPAEHWRRPEQLWVWLPPGDRPAPLDQFGPGARLGALVEALDKHAPQVRQRARELDAEGWLEAGYDEDERRCRTGSSSRCGPPRSPTRSRFTRRPSSAPATGHPCSTCSARSTRSATTCPLSAAASTPRTSSPPWLWACRPSPRRCGWTTATTCTNGCPARHLPDIRGRRRWLVGLHCWWASPCTPAGSAPARRASR